jgi:hypothetical protein
MLECIFNSLVLRRVEICHHRHHFFGVKKQTRFSSSVNNTYEAMKMGAIVECVVEH